jgi:polysaccharide pyruvyl transferase WcaK-like protein
MRTRGLDTTTDHVYPDLAFALPDVTRDAGDQQTVGVGVMAYRGSDDDAGRADAIYAAYLASITGFVRWLLDDGRTVRLFVGDANGSDDLVVREIEADLRVSRPGLKPGRVVAEPVRTFAEVMRAVGPAGLVVATRFHNVLCAVKLGKPTISLGYAAKHRALMADMGLPEFCQATDALDVDLLIKQFTELESRSAELRPTVAERSAANARRLGEQFGELSEVLFNQGRTRRP